MIFEHPQLYQGIGHAVANEGIGNDVSDFIGIASFWWDTGNLGLKIQTTLAPCLVDPDLGDHPTTAVEHADMANGSCGGVFAFTLATALWARVIFGRDDHMLDIIFLSADQLGESHEGSS
ncbi:hypothetical protein C2W62_52965 [Candidatus Entotheonella serta]|nr:hypothetical protein C2W62_52965 [Candidatus Entotheonella serta]